MNGYVCFIASSEIALISYWNDFSLLPLGKLVCFLEESYENMQKKN